MSKCGIVQPIIGRGHGWAFSDCDLDEATCEAIHFLPEVAHTFISCPNCGSPDFRVTAGRDVSVVSIGSPAPDSAAGSADGESEGADR